MENLMLSELSKLVGNELTPIIASVVADKTKDLLSRVEELEVRGLKTSKWIRDVVHSRLENFDTLNNRVKELESRCECLEKKNTALHQWMEDMAGIQKRDLAEGIAAVITDLDARLTKYEGANQLNQLVNTRLNTVELSLINVNSTMTVIGENIKENEETLSSLHEDLSDLHSKYSNLRDEMKHAAARVDAQRLDGMTKKMESIMSYHSMNESRLEACIKQAERTDRDCHATREIVNRLAADFKKSREETVIDEHRPATITMLQAKVSSLEERMNNLPAPAVNQFELERDLTRLFDLYRIELKKEFEGAGGVKHRLTADAYIAINRMDHKLTQVEGGLSLLDDRVAILLAAREDFERAEKKFEGVANVAYLCDQRVTALEKTAAMAKEDAPSTGSSTGDRDLMSHYDELCVNLSDVRCLIREHRKALDDKMSEMMAVMSTLSNKVHNVHDRVDWLERIDK
jgi:hypothetical protein